MFDITPEAIIQRASMASYNKGREYFRNRRIKSVQFNQEKLTFNASVLGTKLYNIHLSFDPVGRLDKTSCTCPAYDNGTWGCCKHIVSVLLLIEEKDRQGFFKELKFRQAARQIFSFFNTRQSILSSAIRLEVNFQLEKGGALNKTGFPSVSLRIGQDKLYVVKDVRKLLECMINNAELVLSKKFTYSPSKHEFEESDLPLINLLKELYETEKLTDSITPGGSSASVFRDRYVFLADTTLKRFFKLYSDRPFKARIYENEHDALNILHEDVPVEFLLSREGTDLLLNIDFEGTMFPMTADGEYFYAGAAIHRISKQQQEYLKPFYMAMVYQKGRKLRFIAEDKERFVSEILPFAEKAGKLVISEQVQSMIEKLPLEAEIYLDRSGKDITADVKFIYGERVINPFMNLEKPEVQSDKLLIRDIAREEAILDILASTDFKVKDGRVHLSGEDNIYEFVFQLVPKLQEQAAVFYSGDLKSIRLKSSLTFSARFKLNNQTDMLEFSFTAEDIDRSELSEIMASLIRKKKYFQLKNGSFLNLQSRELSQLDGLMNHMEITAEDLQKEYLEIPKYRALYLDQSIRDAGIHNIERNHSFKEFVQNIKEPEDMEFEIPRDLKGTLRDYQKFGFKWLKTLDHYRLGGILADDMGLGKTIQIIAFLLSARNEYGRRPSLVVVPTSLVFNWCAELDKFAPGLSYSVIIGNKEERTRLIGEAGNHDVIITSYPLIRRDIDDYATTDFRYCILDEAQHIKNPDSQNAKAAKLIRAEKRFALTGTPMENNLTELWSIFDFALPGYLYSYRSFEAKFEVPASGEEGYEVLQELSKQIKPFTLRRLKRDVLEELPEKIEHTLLAEMTDEQKKIYMAYLQQIKGEIDREIEEKGFERSQIKILAGLTRLRQICCHPSLFIDDYDGESGKLQLLDEIIHDAVDSGHRILLFSQFTGMLQLIRRRLAPEGLECLYLDGSTPSEERGFLVNSFNEGVGKVFLLSLKAGGTGLNLTGADTVIHYDPWWNPAVEDQATDRSYRIGQKKSVHVMKLVSIGTIEEKILKLQDKKRELIDAVIQPGETLLTKMTQEDLRALFE